MRAPVRSTFCLLATLCAYLGSTAQAWCDDGKDALSKHNEYRRRHGVDDLVWDDQIARSAQAWADNLAGRGDCQLVHTQNGRYGENLMSVASQVPMENSCSKASEGWYNEIKDYSFDYSRYPPWTQQWPRKKIGHFTAVVWKATRRVGCGAARGRGANGWRYCYIQVCQYDPAGNVMGDDNFAANVLPSRNDGGNNNNGGNNNYSGRRTNNGRKARFLRA